MRTKKIDLKKKIAEMQRLMTMKCLECVCYQPKEIGLCEIKDCPLWKYRPSKLEGVYSLVKQMRRKDLPISEAKK